MIPYSSCMCFGAEQSSGRRRRAWKLVSAQKGTSLSIDKDDSFCIRFRENEGVSSALSRSELCMLEAVKDVERFPLAYGEQEVRAGGRRTRQPVITRVLDLNLLDDTYNGVTKILLSKCNSWSFNTFNLDVSTGGRSLSYLLVHLFQVYGFVDYFQLDIVKVWHCFNLMEAAYHRHNPYHNSVHAADVTQAMHCFLQENKFAAHLTPLEAMSSVIAAVAHDLDHPGVTQAFLVATSNHLVNLYHNSSVLENHHWRTAISCLSESGIFNHLDREIWLDIQRQIRSLILATDITRQKEFLARFKNYLNSECLDMEKTHYRHFALQIALKCADLCNPCRPWAISQRWSYQVCQEFYRQGAYERQLKLPLTPTFDCSRTKVAKIQADFFQFVVSPLFETWDHFLKTPLSSKLLENLHHNYTQWQQRMEMIQQGSDSEGQTEPIDTPEIKIDSCSESFESLPLTTEDGDKGKLLLSTDQEIVPKQHRSKSDSGLSPGLLPPKIHMETYSTEELHPSTTLLSLSSITDTVQLRKVYAATKVESHLICPTVFQPIFSNTPTKEANKQAESDASPASPPQECSDGECDKSSLKEEEIIIDTNAQSSVVLCCPDGCGTPSPPENSSTLQICCTKQRSHSLVNDSECLKYCSQVLQNRRASDYGPQVCNKISTAPNCVPVLSNSSFSQLLHNKEIKMPSFCDETTIESISNTCLKEGTGNTVPSSMCSNKHCSAITCICEKTESYKKTPSWCWHISRSFSAERPAKPSHDFDSPLPSWQGSASSLGYNTHRRGSAPVTGTGNIDYCGNHLSSVAGVDSKGGLRGGSKGSAESGRRWSIPAETLSGLQMAHVTTNVTEGNCVPIRSGRRSSFGLLEPLLAMSTIDSESSLMQNSSPTLKPIHHNVFSSHAVKQELSENVDNKSVATSDSFLPSVSSSHQSSGQRRGSLPTEVPIALMCHVVSPSHHLRSKISGEQFSSKEATKPSSNRHSLLMEHARKHGSPGDLLSVLIGPSGMLNTMHGIVSGQTICECPYAVTHENSRRRSGGLELLSGLWRSRTNDMAVGSMTSKLKLRRQLLDEWNSWKVEEGNIKSNVSTSSSISALGQQLMHQQRRGSVPINVSLLSLGSGVFHLM